MIIKESSKEYLFVEGSGKDANLVPVVNYYDTQQPTIKWSFRVDGEENLKLYEDTTFVGKVSIGVGGDDPIVLFDTVEEAEAVRSQLDVRMFVDSVELAARHEAAEKKVQELKLSAFVLDEEELGILYEN